ncbi:MAG: ISKra4 family transposase [Candidatus Microthrix parvicella]
MNPRTETAGVADGFEASRSEFDSIVGWLDEADTAGLDHGVLEEQLRTRGLELLRRLFQDHLDLRAAREVRLDGVTDAAGIVHRRVETGHHRNLSTLVGKVTVTRLAYRQPHHRNLYPADSTLNLPRWSYSHGLERLTAIEASRGSYEETALAIERSTGTRVGKRQLEDLAVNAAIDFNSFYNNRPTPAGEPGDVLVISADGKGIVMRPDALRPATATAAANNTHKIEGRLSKGEKRNRKRMAEVGSVYDLTPVPRTPDDIMGTTTTTTTTTTTNDDDDGPVPKQAPKAKEKWVTASVTSDTATVIASIFDEAERRDPDHTRRTIGLVDGNNHQINRFTKEATSRGIDLTIIIDFVHVLEYLWDATWSFHTEGDPAAETWVRTKALDILNGKARIVAAAIRRKATARKLTTLKRKGADKAATYLTNKAPYLDYPTALSNGWPIATGIIEGACRHLIADRLDITGARWGLQGAEAILQLRALRTNGHLDQYWAHHTTQKHHRNHHTRYHNHDLTTAA